MAAKAVWPSRYCWLAFSPMHNSRVESPARGIVNVEPSIALSGHSTGVVRKWYAGSDWFRFQVQFQPGAMFRLTGIPIEEFTNSDVDAGTILPATAKHVNELLVGAKSLDEMVSTVETFLHRWIDHCRQHLLPIDRAIQLMAHGRSLTSLDAAAGAACLSTRQFQRKFVERMGVSPNTYLRVVRLTRAFGYRAAHPDWTLGEVAYASGYYDYQHMTKDFRVLTRRLPAQAFSLERQSPESGFGFSFEDGW